MTAVALVVAVFLACLVEAVEATTIVVAAGATRSWRSALTGTVVALLVLADLVNLNDIGMMQPGDHLGLDPEPRRLLLAGMRPADDHLERDRPVQ